LFLLSGKLINLTQISFIPDGSGVVVSIKSANPPVLFYPFTFNGNLASTSASSPVLGNVPYGFSFTPDSRIVLTDAAPTGGDGGIELLVTSTGNPPTVNFQLPSYFLIPGALATCWIAYSPNTNSFFATNVVSHSVR
jgi:hypothetical protein